MLVNQSELQMSHLAVRPPSPLTALARASAAECRSATAVGREDGVAQTSRQSVRSARCARWVGVLIAVMRRRVFSQKGGLMKKPCHTKDDCRKSVSQVNRQLDDAVSRAKEAGGSELEAAVVRPSH